MYYVIYFIWENKIKEPNKRQVIGNREIDLSQKGKEPRDGEMRQGAEGEEMKKIIKKCYVHAPIPHDGYKHYILQIHTNKKTSLVSSVSLILLW